jgi:hypothetical protein
MSLAWVEHMAWTRHPWEKWFAFSRNFRDFVGQTMQTDYIGVKRVQSYWQSGTEVLSACVPHQFRSAAASLYPELSNLASQSASSRWLPVRHPLRRILRLRQIRTAYEYSDYRQ